MVGYLQCLFDENLIIFFLFIGFIFIFTMLMMILMTRQSYQYNMKFSTIVFCFFLFCFISSIIIVIVWMSLIMIMCEWIDMYGEYCCWFSDCFGPVGDDINDDDKERKMLISVHCLTLFVSVRRPAFTRHKDHLPN